MATTFETETRQLSKEDALEYHSSGRRGKIEVVPTKPVATSREQHNATADTVAAE